MVRDSVYLRKHQELLAILGCRVLLGLGLTLARPSGSLSALPSWPQLTGGSDPVSVELRGRMCARRGLMAYTSCPPCPLRIGGYTHQSPHLTETTKERRERGPLRPPERRPLLSNSVPATVGRTGEETNSVLMGI